MAKRNLVMAVAATIGLLGTTVTPRARAQRNRVNESRVNESRVNEKRRRWRRRRDADHIECRVPVDLRFQPVQPIVELPVRGSGVRTPHVRRYPQQCQGYADAGHGLVLERRNKVLTFTIRKGVTWTDGQPFSAADVAYTFNLLKDNPALDLNTVWSVLSSVVQKGDDVVMTFKTPAVPYFYYIADQVGIVPQHIWSKVGNPVTYKDANPVGTGPFTVTELHAAKRQLRRATTITGSRACRRSRRSSTRPSRRTRRPTRCSRRAAHSGAASSSRT